MRPLQLAFVFFALAAVLVVPFARAQTQPVEESGQNASLPDLSPPAGSDLLGKTIARVDVTVLGDRWKDVPAIKSVKIGEPLSRESARRAMREVLDTGRFARADAEAVAEGDAAVLHLSVVPRRLIQSIQVRGGALDREATLDAAGLEEGGEISGIGFPEVERKLRLFYDKHGFPVARAKVDATDTDNPDKVVLTIDIAPGGARVVAQRVFVIDPKADAQVGALKSKYRVLTGSRVDEQALIDADRELGDLLRTSGFPRAGVSHTTKTEGKTTYLYVYVVPGPRLIPIFEGNRAFDADQLIQALGIDKGEAKSVDFIDRLRTFYVVRGYFDVEVSAAEQPGADDSVHYLAFTIVEHDQVRVVKRVFPCLPSSFDPDYVGSEIQSFLEEDLPGADSISPADPRVVDQIFGPTHGAGGRGHTVDLNPAMTYAPETYEKALKHLRDIFHAKGYLNAVVGPVSVLRATCSKRSRAGECIPEPPPVKISAQCVNDASGLPIAEPAVPEELACRPDPIRHIDCSNEITLRIPLHLGPQSILYDLAFEGNKAYSEVRLAKFADLPLGEPLSNLELEAARLRVLDRYRTDGYAYAEVRTALEPSPDRTRVRARFYVTERDKVVVEGFVVKGATRTDQALILRRVALKKDQPFRQDWARQSEERIATLGTFSSVSVGLEDADVPQKRKRVVITVVEQLPQYLDPRIGFSTGEGLRFAFEYGHRNIGGLAIALTLRVQLSYLFDFMILDPQVKQNYEPLSVGERLERRDTVSISFPEIGLGPLIGLTLDGIDVRDNQRDFGITKQAFVPTLAYRPLRQITTQLSASTELNDVHIFNEQALTNTIQLLRAPEGRTIALAQRVNFTWDARDNPFAATRGVLISTGLEHVDAFPSDIGGNKAIDRSHFLRLTARVAGYVRLTQKGTSVALSIAGGTNIQLTADSKTYPDRLFFLGGVDSIRAFLADQVVPEDIAQRILKGQLTIDQVPIRGGNFFLNPRGELRVPLTDIFAAGLFVDAGNLWVESNAIDLTALRWALGAGLRIATPIGPIALDYGINLDRRPWEDFGAFHFSIGLF